MTNRYQHLVLELSAASRHLVGGGKAKAGCHPGTWHCWVSLEQGAPTELSLAQVKALA